VQQRVDARAHAVARMVREVADERGVTPAQVAIAWTMTRSPAIHFGAAQVAQAAPSTMR
jgi:aryl-alcohol dehydrogenase-like predicted oxidoreductase